MRGGADYYREAMRRMGEDRLFIVFSDDIDWCPAATISISMSISIFLSIYLYRFAPRYMALCAAIWRHVRRYMACKHIVSACSVPSVTWPDDMRPAIPCTATYRPPCC